jgi:uncharacterized phage protein (predicted DNA packaging)
MLSLDEAKDHLRVSFDSDDEYIESLIAAATDYIDAIGVGIDSPPQPAVIHAAKLLVSHWYNAREAASETPPRAIAFGVNALLQPYRSINL